MMTTHGDAGGTLTARLALPRECVRPAWGDRPMTPPNCASVWVVLVDYNGLDDTRNCLQSLSECEPRPHVVVVDNASQVSVAPELAGRFPDVAVVTSDVNSGWAGGNNLGLKYALDHGADLIILLNNDTTVCANVIERLTAAAEAHPDYGIIGPVIRYMAPPHEVQTDGVRFNRPDEPGFFQRKVVPLTQSDPPSVVEVDIVNGCCLMVRREVVAQIGLIDEAFFLIHEESDFCLRAQQAGFKNGVLTESLVYHKGSSTFQREGKGLQRYFDARNLARLLRRHQGRPGSRGTLSGMLHHVRYCYHRYSQELGSGFPDSAEAVLEGLYDAALGRWGPRSSRARYGLALPRIVFRTAHGWKANRSPRVGVGQTVG